MGRRRRKVLRQTHKSLPKVFSCPRCGVVAVRITSQLDETSQDYVMVVACGNASCRLRREFRYPTQRPEIDVYNSFVDEFVRTGGWDNPDWPCRDASHFSQEGNYRPSRSHRSGQFRQKARCIRSEDGRRTRVRLRLCRRLHSWRSDAPRRSRPRSQTTRHMPRDIVPW